MRPLQLATARFLRQFARDKRIADERELVLRDDTGQRSATAYFPRPRRGRAPAWILLHGITVPGRHHAAVRRMGRALAAAGHIAVVPEIERWRGLEVTVREAPPAVRDALHALRGWAEVDPRRIGLMGFSVASTWALEIVSGGPQDAFAAAVGIGGYGDPQRMLRAMVVGEHEWEGVEHRYTPDPYGRWIMGGTLLPMLDGDAFGTQEERTAAGRALRALAVTAGRNGAYSGDAVYDSLIAQVRATMPAGALPAWDLLAPSSQRLVPDRQAGGALADAMAAAALRSEPELDPHGRLEGIRVPVVLMHGESDRLVPYSETLRLAREVPVEYLKSVTVTKLLGHTRRSEAAGLRNPRVFAREAGAFVGFIHALLGAVERRR
jgi:pimeloyl-ACP methyl ester carboxylesterase